MYRERAHLEVMRRRREWFERLGDAFLVLWWVPAGELPTVEEAQERLEHLRAHGPTPYAFTFKARFPSPDFDAEVEIDDELGCPA